MQASSRFVSRTSRAARARSSSRPPARPIFRSPRKPPSRPSSWATTSCRLFDVGVAGLHRLLSERARLESARVIIVVAGMEGALPSVVSGLVSVPVIAVPTSVGYGASFGGIAALLGMLNSCAVGRLGREHRQRLRRRNDRQPDQPPVITQDGRPRRLRPGSRVRVELALWRPSREPRDSSSSASMGPTRSARLSGVGSGLAESTAGGSRRRISERVPPSYRASIHASSTSITWSDAASMCSLHDRTLRRGGSKPPGWKIVNVACGRAPLSCKMHSTVRSERKLLGICQLKLPFPTPWPPPDTGGPHRTSQEQPAETITDTVSDPPLNVTFADVGFKRVRARRYCRRTVESYL